MIWDYLFKLKHQKISYAQNGEDLIIDFAFREIFKISKPSYLDIGAHHPFCFSNTQLFYERGARGINVEANPFLHKVFNLFRFKDKNLNVGIHERDGILEFYILNPSTLSTFDEKEYQRVTRESPWVKLKKKQEIEVLSLPTLLSKFSQNIMPDLLTLDVEGLDDKIIRQIDFSQMHNRPKVICVETALYTEGCKHQKKFDLIQYIESQNYIVFADTFLNTIFVDETQRNAT